MVRCCHPPWPWDLARASVFRIDAGWSKMEYMYEVRSITSYCEKIKQCTGRFGILLCMLNASKTKKDAARQSVSLGALGHWGIWVCFILFYSQH